jgi:hypothetical protein
MWKRGWTPSHLAIGGDFVGGVVVANQVDVEVDGDLVVKLDQELLEFGGAVTTVDRSDDLAGGHIQRREQGRDAVAHVVVAAALRQGRLVLHPLAGQLGANNRPPDSAQVYGPIGGYGVCLKGSKRKGAAGGGRR